MRRRHVSHDKIFTIYDSNTSLVPLNRAAALPTSMAAALSLHQTRSSSLMASAPSTSRTSTRRITVSWLVAAATARRMEARANLS